MEKIKFQDLSEDEQDMIVDAYMEGSLTVDFDEEDCSMVLVDRLE
jgi:hypothetical protein